jgi:hypothetical protein
LSQGQDSEDFIRFGKIRGGEKRKEKKAVSKGKSRIKQLFLE